MVPPRLIRRLVLAPLVIVIALGFIVLSPFLALAALVSGLLARPKAGRMRSLRLVGFALVWLVAETVALIVLAGLWVVSGFGGRLRTEPYQSRHYGVMRWFLDTMYRGAERTYGLRVEVDEPDLTGDELAARLTRPVIVLSRHAGPGDSFLLVHQLLSLYHRRPRVVMKAALQLDPSVDIVGNRLPNVWVKSRQVGEHIFTEQIARLARGLDERGALVIFPEGGNWTPSRWRRGIRRLERLGRPDLAERARDMPNLLPPRPGGALAAIAACPDADVVFVAHAGLDNIITVADVWSKFPVDQVIRARWWRVPDDSVPRSADYEAQVQWLYGWWERIDAWITENRPGMVLAPLSGDEPAGPPGELWPGRNGRSIDQESRSARHRARPSVAVMASIESVTLDVADLTAANRFYTTAFGLDTQVRLRASEAPTTGFRGFTLSLTVSQPATVKALIGTALDVGATPLKPVAKSFWGYGGVVRAPDGTIWKVATSAKKDTGPATRQIDEIVLLLGVADVLASKRFYADRGLAVAKSFGRKYVEFATPSSPVKLALYGRRALAKDAGVAPDGTGSHRIMIGSDSGPFTDPDGFAWAAASL